MGGFWLNTFCGWLRQLIFTELIYTIMFRTALTKAVSYGLRPTLAARAPAVFMTRTMGHGPVESDADFDARYETYFNREDIDAWEIRKAMNDLCGMDLVPEPKIMIAALHACRRLDDFALALRFVEAMKEKCIAANNTIYPYILKEIGPTLQELGVNTPEELGYDKPELAMVNVYDM